LTHPALFLKQFRVVLEQHPCFKPNTDTSWDYCNVSSNVSPLVWLTWSLVEAIVQVACSLGSLLSSAWKSTVSFERYFPWGCL